MPTKEIDVVALPLADERLRPPEDVLERSVVVLRFGVSAVAVERVSDHRPAVHVGCREQGRVSKIRGRMEAIRELPEMSANRVEVRRCEIARLRKLQDAIADLLGPGRELVASLSDTRAVRDEVVVSRRELLAAYCEFLTPPGKLVSPSGEHVASPRELIGAAGDLIEAFT